MCDIKAMSGRNESLKQHQIETSLEPTAYISVSKLLLFVILTGG